MPILALPVVIAPVEAQVASPSASKAPADTAAEWLPGREADARVAAIAYRLATAGIARCSPSAPATGMVLEHLSQFEPADRARLVATRALDRGPQAVALVRGAPADVAGMVPGDVVVAIDGKPLPADGATTMPFDAARARARSDLLTDLVAGRVGNPHAVTVLRQGRDVVVQLTPRSACPSRVRLARSGQRNAYADGRHVFLTTGLLARLAGDDQFAFVVAHEMAHNILGHAALRRAGQPVREEERDADRLGGELMLDAGYDPVAGAEALRRLGGLDLRLFASHDSTADRIEAMRRLADARTRP